MLKVIFMYLAHFKKDVQLPLTKRTKIKVKQVFQGSFVNLSRTVCSKGNYYCSVMRKIRQRLNTEGLYQPYCFLCIPAAVRDVQAEPFQTSKMQHFVEVSNG